MYYVNFSGAVNLTREEYTSIAEVAEIGDVRCVGTENVLTDCIYISRPACGEFDDAGVVCQGKKWKNKLTLLMHYCILYQLYRHSMQSVLVEM